EFIKILSKLPSEFIADPKLFAPFRTDGFYGVPALGLGARLDGTGFRVDGSLQYGYAIHGIQRITIPQALDAMQNATRWPVLPGTHLGGRQRQEFEHFVALAKAKGITLVGVTTPFAPEIVRAMDESPKHEIWREFTSAETREWFRRLGIIYFDFSRLESF